MPAMAQRWLNTGDLGRQDADGYFYLTGRKKELIIRGGHNIDPASIEEPLHQHPAVQLAAAVGRPDAHAGEVPVAYVQLKPGADGHRSRAAAPSPGDDIRRARRTCPRRSGSSRCDAADRASARSSSRELKQREIEDCARRGAAQCWRAARLGAGSERS